MRLSHTLAICPYYVRWVGLDRLPGVTINNMQYLFGHTDNRILLYLAFAKWRLFVDYLSGIECKAVGKVSLRKQSLYICAIANNRIRVSWSLQQFIARVTEAVFLLTTLVSLSTAQFPSKLPSSC